MVYDGENRQTSYTKAGVMTSYAYDGDGRRVKKVDYTGTTVFVYNAGGQLIAEYVENGGGGTVQMSYLSVDHLGSTRVVTDGNQAVKARHDYLPFGEELGSGIGGRSTAMGYSQPDGVRQKFTGYEHDDESGLDFAQARYYSSAQGRFLSADPLLSSGEVEEPQTWNRYSYALNNPLVFTDPSGLYVYGKRVTDEQKEQFEAALKQAKENLKKIAEVYGEKSKEYEKAKAALDAYGEPNKANGVIVTVSDKIAGGLTTRDGKNIVVSFNPSKFSSGFFGSLIGHEGVHIVGEQSKNSRSRSFNEESDAYLVSSVLAEAKFKTEGKEGSYTAHGHKLSFLKSRE